MVGDDATTMVLLTRLEVDQRLKFSKEFFRSVIVFMLQLLFIYLFLLFIYFFGSCVLPCGLCIRFGIIFLGSASIGLDSYEHFVAMEECTQLGFMSLLWF